MFRRTSTARREALFKCQFRKQAGIKNSFCLPLEYSNCEINWNEHNVNKSLFYSSLRLASKIVHPSDDGRQDLTA